MNTESHKEVPVLLPEEKQELLEQLWTLVMQELLAKVTAKKPRAWSLDIARKFLSDNGYKKDISSALQIREALASLEGLDAPLK